ncbi:ATP-grasp domain-containing protein [Rhodopseudomonas sp. BR0C11]|uniref:ATP-grasp domain-containing protein n=1 Tax=Rhodopseudomonas sp. BR0C11 TaxID=2269370 RepID=UPI001FED5497|nr:ATP-grasp domain-containing protein [Rhodopseudomonas sp. BR0C11]
MESLGLPQPPTRIVISEAGLRAAARPPCMIKTSVGTASRGVWLVIDQATLDQAVRELVAADGFADEVLVQDFVAGRIEHAQAVFDRGALLALHVYRQVASGAGGGPARKLSVRSDDIRQDVATIGAALGWHGALSFDLIRPVADARPLYIDCNPRLVEPMSAQLAGLDLVDLLLRLSLGEHPPVAAPPRDGVRSHLGMQVLLGCALGGGTRRDVMREGARLLLRQPPYAGSAEELTPVREDWCSAVPLVATALILLAQPSRAAALAAKGWGDHLLDAAALARIDQGFGQQA